MLHKRWYRPVLTALLFASASVCLAQQQNAAGSAYSALDKPLSYAGQTAVSMAQELIGKKDYSAALKQAEAAIKADPKSGIPPMVKAFILDQLGESKKASGYYASAVKLSPTNGYVLNAYGAHLCEQGDFEGADGQFLKATSDSNYPVPNEALENAGRCSLSSNNLVRAEERTRAALSLNPESASALQTMAQVKFKQSLFMEARAFMQRREALGPLDAPLLELANQIEKSAGDDRAAQKYQKQLDALLQAQIQPPTGEGQKKP